MESFSENADNQFQTAAAVFLAAPLHAFSLQSDLQDKREICSELESIREIEKIQSQKVAAVFLTTPTFLPQPDLQAKREICSELVTLNLTKNTPTPFHFIGRY